MTSTKFKEFIDANMRHNHVESQILKRIVKALKDAGNPIIEVWSDRSGNDKAAVDTLRSIQEQVFNLDEAYLVTKDGGWVFFVNGNEWDAITDYSLSLEDALQPVNDWVEVHW